jgi:broad-specificity NMP kinase
MKVTTEKTIEANNERQALNNLIQEYHAFLENDRIQKELIVDLERNLDAIDQEIIVAQEKANNPVYPKMRNIADVDEFMNNFF